MFQLPLSFLLPLGLRLLTLQVSVAESAREKNIHRMGKSLLKEKKQRITVEADKGCFASPPSRAILFLATSSPSPCSNPEDPPPEGTQTEAKRHSQ